MEDLKKRKLRELEDYGSVSTVQHLVSLLEPLSKPQLVDLLSKLGSQYHFIAEEIKSLASEDPVHRKLFVRGLAWNTTSETLCDAFQIHGEIEEGAVIYDKVTGKSRGYGFITYKNMESTQTALKAPSKMIDPEKLQFFQKPDQLFFNGKRRIDQLGTGSLSDDQKYSVWDEKDSIIISGLRNAIILKNSNINMFPFSSHEIRRLLVSLALKIKGAAQIYEFQGRLAVCNLACEGLTGASLTPDLAQRKLYIGGLAPDITSEILLGFFERHGDIEEGSVAYDKDTNESRGFGFVTYKTVESAKSALDDPNKMLGGSNVIVKLADSHRGKIILGQVPSAASPMALPMVASYPQPGKAQAMAAFGYTYPQALPPYATSYPSPSMGHIPFASQPQLHYPPAPRKKEAFGLQSTTSAGVGGYPYYYYTK